MRERVLVALLLGVALLVSVGCGQEHSSTYREVSAPPSSGEEKPSEIKLEVVKYGQLQDALKAKRGQVIVMDVWASWCVPCKEEFPHLVELHQRHAKDGVVCVSVSLDNPKQRDTALAFLKSKGAAFPNYLLDEGEAGWDKLDLKSIPAVFVYDREGKLARKFTGDDPDNQFTYADVTKFVQEQLARSGNRKEK
jgi:thiol-disulfide isomerase/thioredoxin